MLQTKSLNVEVEHKSILSDLSVNFDLGKNYCILGKNGSGKSSLAMTLMGHPGYIVTHGDIILDNQSLLTTSPDQRAKAGIFLAMQHIPEIKGVKLFEFLRSIYDAKNGSNTSFLQFKKIIEPLMTEIQLEKDFLRRDLNVWFSGGERRKLEVLQIKLLTPKYIILDEVDSGLDVDAFKTVAQLLVSINTAENSLIIITHIFSILESIPVDHVYILEQGKLISEWDQSLAEKIKVEWFGETKALV